jgi:hypothetical protein
MNIFAVHDDPELATRALSDRHVVKMTTETAHFASWRRPSKAPSWWRFSDGCSFPHSLLG